ncbi:trafficking protein particle complex subunit 8, putative [Plasmodium gallinaceum]|uniref:Trafficking protein particle complex subunit 8, putative n=1 Tax=Plasmodium gallinaceum TaxID=5849 RepID=A0A1J1H2V9_PLAGA|nr:trafficking protein particle complex subunit 8, putative [Plasmodium gallinaceum]CRG97828.1 trafficking protein particle complex subunit 8, putative [Plasmodium gallinaceum]
MANYIEEELKNIINDIYLSTILIDSSRIVKREVSFFLGVSVNDLFQPLGRCDYFFDENKEKIDLKLNVSININYLNKNNALCEKVIENKNFQIRFINFDEYEDMKLEYLDKVLIDNISYNEPQYSDIYNEENFNAYFKKNDKDNISFNKKYFEYICANSSILNNDIKNNIIKNSKSNINSNDEEKVLKKSNSYLNKKIEYNDSNSDDNYDLNHFCKKKYINNIEKYNAFFLPWFYEYFKTSWNYTNLYNNSSTPLGIIYICSTKDNNIIDLYKSMIKNNVKKKNIYINSNVPKCIILLHISNNNNDDIETDVQKLFVNIQSTFLNYKCHLLIIKAHRFLKAYEKYESHINNTTENICKLKIESDQKINMSYENSYLTYTSESFTELKNDNKCNFINHESNSENNVIIRKKSYEEEKDINSNYPFNSTEINSDDMQNSKNNILNSSETSTYFENNFTKKRKNITYSKKKYHLNNIQKLYINYLSIHFKDFIDDGIKVAKNDKDIEESKKIKKKLSEDLNKIYDYILSNEVICISKKIPLYIDDVYFCCCLDYIDIISLKMFIHNFIKTCVIPYINVITHDINNLIVNNKKSLKNQLKFMWKKTKMNFSSSDAALFVAEQTSNVILNVAQNVLISSNDNKTENKNLKDINTKSIISEEKEIVTNENEELHIAHNEYENFENNENKRDSVKISKKSINNNITQITKTNKDSKNYNKESLEWLYKTLCDIYFILREYELSYNILKICINEFKHDKMYFYLGNVYELISLCIYYMDNVNKKDSLYYLDLSYQMYSKCNYLNNMFICSILNYYLSLIYDENNETSINILINANMDFSYVEEKLVNENKLTKLSFQINNIRSGLLLEQITYSYKKKKINNNIKELNYIKNFNSYNKIITNIVNKNVNYFTENIKKKEDKSTNNEVVDKVKKENNEDENTTVVSNHNYTENNSHICKNNNYNTIINNDNSIIINNNMNNSTEKMNSIDFENSNTNDVVLSNSAQNINSGKMFLDENNNNVEYINNKMTDNDTFFLLQANNYKYRKYLFEMTLAGHTFNKCGFKKLALFCYSKVLKKYEKKKMKHIYEHLHFMMARQAFSINLYYESLNHYICILNSISKNYEKSYVLNKNVDIYCASTEKEINFIREFAYVYKIYVDKILNRYLKYKNNHNDNNNCNLSSKRSSSCTSEKINRIHYFNDDNIEDIIKPLNLRIPLINLRNDECLYTNSIFVSKSNIYNYDKINDINYFYIFDNNLFKIKKYDTTLEDLYNIMTKDISDFPISNFYELNYLYITYKKFVNSIYSDCIVYESTDSLNSNEKIINDSKSMSILGNDENNTSLNSKCDKTIIDNNSKIRYIKSINSSPFISIENKKFFLNYVKELKEKLVNSLEFTNSTQIKNIYQKTINKEEIKINNKFIQYISKGEYIYVTFKLINPLHTKVECQGTHICAYYYNESMNKDIIVEKKIFILEARQSKTFTLFIKPLKQGLLFISGVMWYLFGLVKVYQNFYIHGLKRINKKYDKMHTLKYDDIYNCDNNIQKKEKLKKLNKEMNKYTWSNNIGMIEKKSLERIKNYEIDQRLLLYVYDNMYFFSFEFENIYSNKKRTINNYEVDLIELLEGENMEIIFKIVNHSTMPVNYLSISITPCNFFNCYKIIHNKDKYFLNDKIEKRFLKNKEETNEDECNIYNCNNFNEKNAEGIKKNESDISIDNEIYCEESIDKNTNVFKQKFKNKNIQHIKIKGNINKDDAFYLYINVNSKHNGLHKCIITTLCKHNDEMSSKKDKSSSKDLKYPDILNEKKERCYLFLRLMHIIPLIKLKTYSLNNYNNKNSSMYFFFQNLCKNNIYLYNIIVEYRKSKNLKDKKRILGKSSKNENKDNEICEKSYYTKLYNFYSSDFLYLKKNENLTSLLYSKSSLQNISSFFVHINWVSKDSNYLRKGIIKKKVNFYNDLISFSIDEINKDIYMNNEKEKIIKIGINIQNNSEIDLKDCYIQAKEIESINSSSYIENYNDDNELSIIDYEYESEDNIFNNRQELYKREELNGISLNEENNNLLNNDDIYSLNNENQNFMKSDNEYSLINGNNFNPIINHQKNTEHNLSDNCKKIKDEKVPIFSYKSSLNDEINSLENKITKKVDLSNYFPITASYRYNENFDVILTKDLFLYDNLNDNEKLKKDKNLKENYENVNSFEKLYLSKKYTKKFHDIVKNHTYTCSYNNCNLLIPLNGMISENMKKNNSIEKGVSLDGFLFIGIVQQYLKKLKKHQKKKIYFNILFTKEGIYNINKFHVIFKLNNQTFIFKPLNHLIIHAHQ